LSPIKNNHNQTLFALLRRSTALSWLAGLLLAAVLLVSGCASVKTTEAMRAPKELYDKGVKEYMQGRYEDAETTLRALMEQSPLSPYALRAELILGDVSYASGKFDEAAAYYTNFTAMHPGHARAAYALFQKGMSHFKDILSIDRDQTSTRKALFAFEDLRDAYPDSPYSKRAVELISFLRRRLAERELYIARFYFKGKKYKGALRRLREILEEYPDSGLSDSALYYIGESYRRLGEQRLSRDAFAALVKDFPESRFADEAKSRL